MEKAVELLKRHGLKQEWRSRAEKLLRNKIDVTSFMVDLIGNYPRSFYEYQNGSVPGLAVVSSQLPLERQTQAVGQQKIDVNLKL